MTNRLRSPKALYLIVALLLAGATLAASSTAGTEARAGAVAAKFCPRSGAKVIVTALGNVTLNGAPVPVDNLAAALNGLVPRPTEVCYFRERPKGEPPLSVRAVVNALISTHLPISFYSDATFSGRVAMPSR